MKSETKQPLTHSSAHYLVGIDYLMKQNGYARLTDIAKYLDISPGSCLTTLKKLKKRGLVLEDENKFYKLTESAESTVILINRNKELVTDFLQKVLQVSKKQADADACKIEHLISLESSFKLARFMNFIGGNSQVAKTFVTELKKEKYVCWKEFTIKNDL